MCEHTTWIVQTILIDTSTGEHVDYLEIDQDDYLNRSALARQFSEVRSWLKSVYPAPHATYLETHLKVIYRPSNTSKECRIYKIHRRYRAVSDGVARTLEKAVKDMKEEILAEEDTPAGRTS